jgi:uroporphyrinogen-III synthase
MHKKVFISRELSADSIFLAHFREMKHQLFAQSLIEFKAIPFSEIPKTDWIFFYSKTAVRFFFEGLSKTNASNKVQAKIACMGKATAKAIEQKDLVVDFHGSGIPKETAELFLNFSENKTVLFPRAMHSKKSIQKQLKGKIIAHDLIVYDNQPKIDFDIPKCDILIFTSPMNAQVYYSKYLAKTNQALIALGKTTAKALRKLGLDNIIISETPSEEGMWETVKDILKED